MTTQGKDYFDLVKSIGESKSKQEEDRIVAEEVSTLTALSSAYLISLPFLSRSLGHFPQESCSTAEYSEEEAEGTCCAGHVC